MDGFGMCSKWAPALNSAQADAFFNTLGFSLHRCGIDATSNFSTEAANASAAHARGAKVFGTPWSPPASMKSNGNLVGGSLNTGSYAAYASYLAGAANSIGLDYVSIQNEPNWLPDYESCGWTATQLLNFCKNNAQNIGKPVIMPETVGFQDEYSDPTLNDSTAASHITYVGGHFYGAGNYVHQNALNHGKHVWMTEHYYDNYDIGVCLNIAKEISDALNNSFSAYVWWRAFHTTYTSDDLINGSTLLRNGYTMGQFSKWIRPGKQRISSTYNPTSGIYVTAYRGGGLVIVALNNSSSAVNQTFSIANVSGVSTLNVHRTSNSENMASKGTVTVSNNSFTYSLPAQSITTFHQF